MVGILRSFFLCTLCLCGTTHFFLTGTNIFITLVLYDNSNNYNEFVLTYYMLNSTVTDQLQSQNKFRRAKTQNHGDKNKKQTTKKLNQLMLPKFKHKF